MKLNRTLLSILASSLFLTGTFSSCGSDDNSGSDQEAKSESGKASVFASSPCADEAACKKGLADAEKKLDECDFNGAFELYDSVYMNQVASNKVDLNVALSRSVLGFAKILHSDAIQKILPKLGFKNASVDFQNTWKIEKGLFYLLTTKMSMEEEDEIDVTKLYKALPLIYNDGEVSLLESIDKKVTFDEVLDALVNIKPMLEDLAASFEIAASKAEKGKVYQIDKAKCSFNNFKFDASDLYTLAAFYHALDAVIDFASKYDWNFSIYDYYKKSKNSFYDDDESCSERKAFVSMLDEHLFKKTTSKRTSKGNGAKAAIKNVASMLTKAINAKETGYFIQFSSAKQGELKDMLDILAQFMKDDKADLSQFVKPSLVIDLDKAFNNVPYRSYKIKPAQCDNYLEDMGDLAIGEDEFFNVTYLNEVSGSKIREMEEDEYDVYYSWNEKYDGSVSSDWDDRGIKIDPNGFFGFGFGFSYGYFLLNPWPWAFDDDDAEYVPVTLSCMTDDDCDPIYEECVFISLVEGECRMKCDEGQHRDDDGYCMYGGYEECENNSDCDDGYVCEYNECVLGKKDECSENTDCGDGYICKDGECIWEGEAPGQYDPEDKPYHPDEQEPRPEPAAYRYVRIDDLSTASEEDQATPGADIASVILKKQDGSFVYAEQVVYFVRADGTRNSNDPSVAANPSVVLGQSTAFPDFPNDIGTCYSKSNEAYSFVSLGGRNDNASGVLIVEMAEGIEAGDELTVLEVGDCAIQDAEGNPAIADAISVYVSVYEEVDGPWQIVAENVKANKGVISVPILSYMLPEN